jgi:hypothetical protein
MDNDLKKKLQALKAMAERGTIHEAAVAAEKLREMLVKHCISLDEIAIEEIKTQDFTVGLGLNSWKRSLICMLGRHYFCRVIVVIKSPIVKIVGEEINVVTTTCLYSYMLNIFKRLAKEAWPEYKGTDPHFEWVQAFFVGCIETIDRRLTTNELNILKDDKAIILHRMAKVDNVVAKQFPDLHLLERQSLNSVAGFNSGIENAKKIGLNPQLHVRLLE